MPLGPTEVLAGATAYQAELATGLLRDAGIPVQVLEDAGGRPFNCRLFVAWADEEQALKLLAAHRFLETTIPADGAVVLGRATGSAPGDDVWTLLTHEEPPWPSVYTFPGRTVGSAARVQGHDPVSRAPGE